MLTPDEFTRAIQAVVDAFCARSNMRTYGCPDVQVWADASVKLARPRSPGQLVEALLVQAIQHNRQGPRGRHDARLAINRAKYILLNYT